MPIKKPTLKVTTARKAPTVAPTAPVTPPRQKVDLVALAKRSQALRDQHINTPLVAKKPAKAIRYIIEYDDGTVLYAEHEHADVLYRYAQECEQLCNVQGLAYYDGPAMQRLTREDLRAKLGFFPDPA